MNVLIVGGRTGLGREYSQYCREKGRQFKIVSSTKGGEFNSHILPCNLSKPDKVNDIIQKLIDSQIKFDAIVFFQRSRHHDKNNHWQQEFDVSVTATRIFLKNAVNLLKDDGLRSIVAIGSTVTRFLTSSAEDSYQISKSAQLQLIRYYALHLGSLGIRVNAISPFTFIKKENKDFYINNDEWNKIVKNRIPLQRHCTTKDIISAIEFLIGDTAQMITGQDLIIDGGLSLSLGVDL
jgi:3-oxoacyl-[acyl-carrier protein] reductase